MLLIFFSRQTLAISESECDQNWKQNIPACIGLWSDLRNQASQKAKSLKTELIGINTSIAITTAQIEKLKGEIAVLLVKIGNLDLSLDQLSEILAKRIAETYKKGKIDTLSLLFSSKDFSDFISRYKYLRVIQLHDRSLMVQMETVRTNYDDQKTLKEQKQKEMEKLEKKLKSQRQQRNVLLEATQNSEKRYQSLVDEATQELQALNASKFTGKKHIAKGDVIGLMGNSGFSTGPHLHFGVYDLKESDADKFNYFSGVQDPFSYLSSKTVLFDSTSCDDISFSQSKTVGSGSWNWPMGNSRITQCFGHTPWSWRYQGNFHHGVDMADTSDILVRAAEEGEAYFYRGQGSLGNNVRIFHPNGKMTLYLHLQ